MLATAFTFMLTACEKDNTPEIPSNSIYQDIEGVIEEGQTIEVTGKHLRIPEGKSLTINAGATIIFSDKGVGTNKAPIEFTVDGNLYCLGTVEKPVMLTVAEELRTEGNTFAALWGGIVAGRTCECCHSDRQAQHNRYNHILTHSLQRTPF